MNRSFMKNKTYLALNKIKIFLSFLTNLISKFLQLNNNNNITTYNNKKDKKKLLILLLFF